MENCLQKSYLNEEDECLPYENRRLKMFLAKFSFAFVQSMFLFISAQFGYGWSSTKKKKKSRLGKVKITGKQNTKVLN